MRFLDPRRFTLHALLAGVLALCAGVSLLAGLISFLAGVYITGSYPGETRLRERNGRDYLSRTASCVVDGGTIDFQYWTQFIPGGAIQEGRYGSVTSYSRSIPGLATVEHAINHDGDSYRVRCGFWTPTLLFGAYPLLALHRGPLRRRRRRKRGLCVACGYDLTGNVTGKCSECGTVLHPAHPGCRNETLSDVVNVSPTAILRNKYVWRRNFLITTGTTAVLCLWVGGLSYIVSNSMGIVTPSCFLISHKASTVVLRSWGYAADQGYLSLKYEITSADLTGNDQTERKTRPTAAHSRMFLRLIQIAHERHNLGWYETNTHTIAAPFWSPLALCGSCPLLIFLRGSVRKHTGRESSSVESSRPASHR